MGVEELKEQIINEAQKKADAIKAGAEAKSIEIIKEVEKKVDKLREENLRKAEEEARLIKAKIIGEAKLEGRNLLLAAKQELISKTIEKALTEISKMPDKEYLEIIERQLFAIDFEELKRKCIIELSEKDSKRISRNWFENVQRKLVAKNPSLELELSNNFRKDFTGGFIIKTAQFEINNSLEAIVKSKIDSLERELAKILFE